MNHNLVMAQDVREMVRAFPPSLFVPALCGILAKEVLSPTALTDAVLLNSGSGPAV